MARGKIELLDNPPDSQEFVTNDNPNRMLQPAPNTSNSDLLKQLGVRPAPNIKLYTHEDNVRTQYTPRLPERPSR